MHRLLHVLLIICLAMSGLIPTAPPSCCDGSPVSIPSHTSPCCDGGRADCCIEPEPTPQALLVTAEAVHMAVYGSDALCPAGLSSGHLHHPDPVIPSALGCSPPAPGIAQSSTLIRLSILRV